MKESSWENVSTWYDNLVGEKGHYYHQNVILPHLLTVLEQENIKSWLDLACGQGVVSRHIPNNIRYFGVDKSSSLINEAKKRCKNKSHKFICNDITKPIGIDKHDFDIATVILAIQDIANAEKVITTAKSHLKHNGRLIIVLNHPCFRIPRQSSWIFDYDNNKQSRRVDNYLTHMDIPIKTNPSKDNKSQKVTFYHRPLSYYSHILFNNSFAIEDMFELISNKKSRGKHGSMENRARKEIPLFLMINARKIN
jgi:ubiquinone/menaquinone biosynthesis C-methylase UbiE